MKKVALILSLIGILPSCCLDSELDYVKINSVSLNTIINTGEIQKVTIWIDYLDYDYIANVRNNSLLIKSAHAYSCRNEGGNGLKPRIDSIILISNNPFNNILPGNSINQYTQSYYRGWIDGETKELYIETNEIHY